MRVACVLHDGVLLELSQGHRCHVVDAILKEVCDRYLLGLMWRSLTQDVDQGYSSGTVTDMSKAMLALAALAGLLRELT